MRKIVFILLILITPCLTAGGYYQFATSEQEKRFETLTSELRCLVCQNQSLADSNASIAVDLRGQIYLKILRGESNKEIINYLVSRYGDFILYRPRFTWLTVGLWLGPFLLLIAGVGYLIFYLRKNKHVHSL